MWVKPEELLLTTPLWRNIERRRPFVLQERRGGDRGDSGSGSNSIANNSIATAATGFFNRLVSFYQGGNGCELLDITGSGYCPLATRFLFYFYCDFILFLL